MELHVPSLCLLWRRDGRRRYSPYVVERYLTAIKDNGADTLLLGCTHYPLLKKVIQEAMGDICLVDSAIQTALW